MSPTNVQKLARDPAGLLRRKEQDEPPSSTLRPLSGRAAQDRGATRPAGRAHTAGLKAAGAGYLAIEERAFCDEHWWQGQRRHVLPCESAAPSAGVSPVRSSARAVRRYLKLPIKSSTGMAASVITRTLPRDPSSAATRAMVVVLGASTTFTKSYGPRVAH